MNNSVLSSFLDKADPPLLPRQCFNAYPAYTAIAALVNIPATLLGCFVQVTFLSDTARLIVLNNLPPGEKAFVDTHLASRAGEEGFQGGAVSMRQLSNQRKN